MLHLHFKISLAFCDQERLRVQIFDSSMTVVKFLLFPKSFMSFRDLQVMRR